MGASTEEEILFPRQAGLGVYSGNLNFETRFPQRATPAFGHVILSTTDRLHYGVRAIETQAPTTFNPRQYCGINKTMWRLDNGAETSDTTFNDVIQGQVIANNGSGAKILLVGFGQSTNPRIAYRDLSTDTTPWTTQTTSTYAQFFLIEKAGPDLYAQTDAGVAILGEYRISKCPAGNDPTLAASWGNGIEVGTPEWTITGMAAIGDSIVVGKPDGLYYFNDQTKRFENVLPFLIDAPHAVNGKGMRAVPNGVVYPTHDGHLFFFDGVTIQDVSPDRGVQSRDAGYARIAAVAPIGDEVYAVRESWQKTTQGLGLTVIAYIAGTATDVTASVIDGSLATGATMSTFGNAANDRLYVGSDQPLEAICVRVTTNVNAAAVAFATPLYSNGTTGSALPFGTSFTAFSGIRDGSQLGTSGISLANTAFPPSASNAVITWTDINGFDLSTVTSLQFGGSIGTISKYWYALKATASGTGMTASTRIDELEVIPSRAGIPITAANDFTHRWRAGGLTEVLVAKITGTTQWQWHSVYHLDMGGGVWAAAWHSGRPGQASGAQNLGQQLVCWGRYARAMIMESPLRDVGRTIAPVLAAYGTTKPGPLLDLAPGGTYLESGDPQNNRFATKVLDGFTFIGDFIQASDTIRIYVQMDEIDIKKAVEVTGSPWYVNVNDSFRGMKMQAWLEFADAAAGDIHSPDIGMVKVHYHYEQGDLPKAANTATPEST